jgi:hypothetical protein
MRQNLVGNLTRERLNYDFQIHTKPIIRSTPRITGDYTRTAATFACFFATETVWIADISVAITAAFLASIGVVQSTVLDVDNGLVTTLYEILFFGLARQIRPGITCRVSKNELLDWGFF